MARPIRVEFVGAIYHVVARGNRRGAIFQTDGDRVLFLKTAGEMVELYGVVLRCYCLMSNHYHFVVETPLGNLSRALGWFQTAYSVRYNWRHRRSGHFFQGRFKAHLIEEDAYAQEVVRYIHLNPVRIGCKGQILAKEKKSGLASYAWSSHRYYQGKSKGPEWLDLKWLSFWGRTREAAHVEYNRFMGEAFEKEIKSPWDNLRSGLVMGGERLWRKVRQIVANKKGEDETRWNEIEDQTEREKRVRELVQQQKDDRIKIWIRIKLGRERKVDLGRELGYKDGDGIHRVIERLERRALMDLKLKKTLAKLKASSSGVGS